MENNEPNKIVKRIYLKYQLLVTKNEPYKTGQREQLCKELNDLTNVVGAIEVMSKKSILMLVSLQSSLRFMQHHSFYIQFSKACSDILNK